MEFSLTGLWIAVALLVVLVAVLIGVLFIVVFNWTRIEKNTLEQTWADVGILLQRRDALLPKLIEMAERTLSHERTTLEAVIQARAQAHQAPDRQARMRAEDAIGTAVSRLVALVESYPQLTAIANFKPVHEELVRTENDIAGLRQFYNETCRNYNDYVLTFPVNLMCSLLRLGKEQYL